MLTFKRRKLVFHSIKSSSFRGINKGCGKEETYARDIMKKELMSWVAD